MIVVILHCVILGKGEQIFGLDGDEVIRLEIASIHLSYSELTNGNHDCSTDKKNNRLVEETVVHIRLKFIEMPSTCVLYNTLS